MSFYRWFSVEKKSYLPDSNDEVCKEKQEEVQRANEMVLAAMAPTITTRKRASSTNNYYPPELRAKIGKYATECLESKTLCNTGTYYYNIILHAWAGLLY